MALRVISGLKDVGPPRPDALNVLGMFLGCLPNVCEMFATLLVSSWPTVHDPRTASCRQVARLYRCVLFEVRDPDG